MGNSVKTVVETLDPIAKRLLPPQISNGTLVPLKTVLELRDILSLFPVYVTRAPQQHTSAIFGLAKRLTGGDGVRNLPHLRRCLKPADLPPHLKNAFVNEGNGRNIHMNKSQWLYTIIGPKSELIFEQLQRELRSILGTEEEVWLAEVMVPLVAPNSQAQAIMWSQEFWQSIYRKNNPLGPHPSTLARAQGAISKDAPIWLSLADSIAKKAKKCGMGESIGAVIVKRTFPGRADSGKQGTKKQARTQKEEDGEQDAGENEPCGQGVCDEKISDGHDSDAASSDGVGMDDLLSGVTNSINQLDISQPGTPPPATQQTATQSQSSSLPTVETKEKVEIVAIAGDARWHQHGCFDDTGNPMAHAPLRAISMVAQKLVRSENRDKSEEQIMEFECFQDKPLLTDEQVVFDIDHPSPDGYLCHDLELYLSHEPCTMCSMGILHSRMGKVIFRRRMPLTGGMTSEDRPTGICGESGMCKGEGSCGGGQGLGLHFRKELNWTLFGWEFEAEDEDLLPLDPHIHA
ncbi:hypothetical protein F5B19DRAFT_491116 [Rostrohypoxylon terebratum]|nr:hypothetical protein F5B19DRAFT_491116 [Rostrohypoxylon terebratum]